MLEEWLLKKDEYPPLDEKNNFIEKNLNSFIKVIQHIKETGYQESRFSKVNPNVKVLITFLFILTVSLFNNYKGLLIIDTGLIINFLFVGRGVKKSVFLRTFFIMVFSVFILLPSIVFFSRLRSLILLQKIFTTVFALNLTVLSTKWNDVVNSLKLFKIPDLFIWILHLTLKHIVCLGDRTVNLVYSMKLRSVGRNRNKVRTLSNIIGNLFLSSIETSQEMAAAMECRGFTGEYSLKKKNHLEKIDCYYTAFNFFVFVLAIVFSI